MAAVNIARFNIQITGQDQASPVLNNVGRAAQQLFQGLQQAGVRGFNIQLAGVSQSGRRTSGALQSLFASTKQAASALRGASLAATGLVGTLSALAAAAGPAAAALVLIVGSLAAFSKGIAEAARFEQTSIAFATLIGDVEESKTVLTDLVDFAARTPFQLPEIEQATRQLLAFGSGTDTVADEIRRLGDISSAISEPLVEIANLYGKARVEGRAYTRDIIQFQSRGIPIIQTLAAQLGVSTEAIRRLTKEGKIGFEEIQRAIFSLTDPSGAFFGLTERQSQSLIGLWSTLRDEFRLLLRDFGAAAIPVLREVLRLAIEVVQGIRRGLAELRRFFGIEFDFTEGLEDRLVAREIPIEFKLEPNRFFSTLDELQQRAAQLNEQFRTPQQIFRDTIDELNLLKGELDDGVFEKVFAKAKLDATEALEKASGIADLRSRAESITEQFDPLAAAKASLTELNALLANDLIGQNVFAAAVRQVNEQFSERLGIVQKIKATLEQTTTAPLLRRGSVAEIQARFDSGEQVGKLEAIRKQMDFQNRLIENLITATQQERIVNVDLDAVLEN